MNLNSLLETTDNTPLLVYFWTTTKIKLRFSTNMFICSYCEIWSQHSIEIWSTTSIRFTKTFSGWSACLISNLSLHETNIIHYCLFIQNAFIIYRKYVISTWLEIWYMYMVPLIKVYHIRWNMRQTMFELVSVSHSKKTLISTCVSIFFSYNPIAIVQLFGIWASLQSLINRHVTFII